MVSPKRSIALCASAVMLLAVSVQTATAGITTFTSSTDFFAALGLTPFETEDYESYGLDSTIPPGTELMGVTYNTWPTEFGGLVGNDFANFDAQSLYLERDGLPGQGDSDFFFTDDTFSISFSTSVTAIGMFFNVGTSDLVSDYMFISTPVGTALTGGASPDTGTFFFAGLISDEAFSTATLGASGAPTGWNADNLVFAPIPEPATFALLAATGVIFRRRRR